MEERLTTYVKKKKTISNSVTVVVTVAVCLGCWMLGYFGSVGIPLQPDINATPIWHKISLFFQDKNLFAYLTGCGLIFFTSFIIQRGSYLLLIIKGKTLLPFLFYLLLNSTNADYFPVRPSAVALLFLLAAIFELFHSYQKPVNVGKIYNASMFIALGSLIWVYLLWFIPLFWYGMYKFRLLNIRSFFASFLGVFTTYWFVLAWCVWKHDYSFILTPVRSLANIDMVSIGDTVPIEKIIPPCFIMLVLSGILMFNKVENTLRTRQYLSFLMVFSICAFILIFLYEQDIADILSVFYIPTAVLFAYFFSNKYDYASYLFYYGLLFFLVMLFMLNIWNIL